MSQTAFWKLQQAGMPEFMYTFGDPRSKLVEYVMHLATQYKVSTDTYPAIPESGYYEKKHVIQHKCNKNVEKMISARGIAFPKGKNLQQEIETVIRNSTSQFIALPVLLRSKKPCKINERMDNTKHLILTLYNTATKEVIRLDMKKYHVERFRVKLSFQAIKRRVLGKYVELRDKKSKMASELDVSETFMKLLKVDNVRIAFPFYFVSALNLMMANPELNMSKIRAGVNRVSVENVMAWWNDYKAFSIEYEKKHSGCKKEDVVEKYETMKCIAKTSSELDIYKVEQPSKDCKDAKIYDMYQNKCVSKEKISEFLVPTLKKGLHIRKKTELVHLGSTKTTLPAILHIISKFPHATYVLPKTYDLKDKKTYSFIYTKTKRMKHMKLYTPKGYWKAWDDAMLRPARFLVTSIGLILPGGGGAHANVLIFDKETGEMEHFDSLGTELTDYYETGRLYEQIRDFMMKAVGRHLPANFKYIVPSEFCPRLNKDLFQGKEMEQVGYDEVKGGACAIWRLWYIYVRMANPNMPRENVVKFALKKLGDIGNITKYIRRFQLLIINEMIEEGRYVPSAEDKEAPAEEA